jgi:hypothetical protein
MVINFKAYGISRGARKLIRIPMLKKKIIKLFDSYFLLKENKHERKTKKTLGIFQAFLFAST